MLYGWVYIKTCYSREDPAMINQNYLFHIIVFTNKSSCFQIRECVIC